MLRANELAGLDAWLTRTPDEQPMYCELCGLNADDCEEIEEHEGHWVTMAERAADEQADYAFDAWNEERT